MKKFLVGFGSFLILAGQIGALLLHVWTILLAFQLSGFFAACITFVAPVLAEIYWFIALWNKAGFLNLYTLAVLAVVLIFAAGGGLALLSDARDQKEAA